MLMAPYSITSLSHRSSIIWLRENRPNVTIVKARDAGPLPPLPVGRARKRKVHRYGQFAGVDKSKIEFIRFWDHSQFAFPDNIKWRVRNFISLEFFPLKIVAKTLTMDRELENFGSFLPIRLTSSGTSFFQARHPSRGLPRYPLPCPWDSRVRRICYSICKDLNIW